MGAADRIDIEGRSWSGGRAVLGTWNTAEVIGRNRSLSVEQRVKRMIEVSNAALQFSRSRLIDLNELDQLSG